MSVARKGSSWRLRERERVVVLIVGDLIVAGIAALLAIGLWAQFDYLGFSIGFVTQRAAWFIYLPLVWLILMVNLYDVHVAANWRKTWRRVMVAAGTAAGLYLLVYFTSGPGSLPRRGVLYFLVLVFGLTLVWRRAYIRIFTAPALMRRVLIVGAGLSGRTLLKVVNDLWPQPFFLVGLVDDDQEKQGMEIEGARVIGDSSQLMEIVEEHDVSDVIVSIMGSMNGEMFQALLDLQEQGVEITRFPVAYEDLVGRVPIRHLESDWLLRSFVDEARVSGVYLLIKRLLDLFGATLGLAVFLFFLPWAALAVLVDTGRPVFYPQTRCGRGGDPFQLIKFRTMYQDAEADGVARWTVDDDPRMTAVGKVLRKIYVDELPQFWNVLKGDMSLVGPRPERPEMVADLEKEIPFYRARLLVKPGITGWAQVNTGKLDSVPGSGEKLEYDLYYIKHRSLLLDLWIVLRTAFSVVGRQGT